MKKTVTGKLIKIISILNKIIKKRNIILFFSFPDVSDNCFALFDYLVRKEKDKEYLLVWLIDDVRYLNRIKKNIFSMYGSINIKFIKKGSIRAILYYLISKYVFYTHGLFKQITPSPNQIVVNLWHGMPIKRIGLLDNKKEEELPQFHYSIATSDIFVDIMAQTFGVDKEKILNIGQPRNDLLFRETYVLEKLKLNKEFYQKIFLWMPTYRESVTGDIRKEGLTKDSGLPLLTLKQIKQLNEFLNKENCFLIVKLHPMDRNTAKSFAKFSNIIFIDNSTLLDINEQLYSLIGVVDALITDYSSVYFDFLVLNKPIGFTCDDYNIYKADRGFLFSSFDKFTPGIKINSYEDFIKFILDVKNGNDEHKGAREEVNALVNKYYDANNSQRLVQLLGI